MPRSHASILIVEDDLVVAHDIACTLSEAGYVIAGEVPSATDALDAVRRYKPDLVLLDIHLGEGDDGLHIAAALDTRVLFVSGRSDLPTVRHAAKTLARGFVVKPFSPAQLLASVELALASSPHGPPDELRTARDTLTRIAHALEQAGFTAHVAPAPGTFLRHLPELDALTPREREIVQQLLEHRRTRQIAKKLFISVHTVRNHLKAIYAKLGVHSQAELMELLVVRGEDDV